MGMNPFYDTPTPEREKGDGAQCKDGEGDANHHIERHDQRLHSGLTGPYNMDTQIRCAAMCKRGRPYIVTKGFVKSITPPL